MFNWNIKNYTMSEPQYRHRGGFLFIKNANPTISQLTIRVGYYPPPEKVTIPDTPLYYVTTMPVANKANISEIFYVELPIANQAPTEQQVNSIMLYLMNNVLYAEWYEAQTTYTLYNPPIGIKNIVYYKGYMYWITAGDIWRVATDLATPFGAPAQITVVGNVDNFSISDNFIYYSDGAQTFRCTITGTGTVLAYGIPISDICIVGYGNNTEIVGLTNTGNVVWTGGIIYTNVLHVVSDHVNLYVVDNVFQVHKLTLDVNMNVDTDNIIHYDVQYLGNWYGAAEGRTSIPTDGRLAAQDEETLEVHAISDAVDTDFASIQNIVPEMMSYRAAIDFKMKQNNDSSKLEARLAELRVRFSEVVKRDEGTVERIQNYYGEPNMMRI